MSFLKGFIADARVSAKVAEPHQAQSTTVPGMNEQGAMSQDSSWISAPQHSAMPATNADRQADRQSAARQGFTVPTMSSGTPDTTQSVGEPITPDSSAPTLPAQTPSQREMTELPVKTVTREMDWNIDSAAGRNDETILTTSAPDEEASNVYGESALFSVPSVDAYEHEIFRTDGNDGLDVPVPKTGHPDDDAETVEHDEALPAAISVAGSHRMETGEAIKNEPSISVRTDIPPTPAAKGDGNGVPDLNWTRKIPDTPSTTHMAYRDPAPAPSALPQPDENRSVPEPSSKQAKEAGQSNRAVVTSDVSAPQATPVAGKRAKGSEKHAVQIEAPAPPAQTNPPLSPAPAMAEPVSASADPAPQKLAQASSNKGGKSDGTVAGQQRRDEQSRYPTEHPQPPVVQRAVPSRQPDTHRSAPTPPPASPQAGEIKPAVQAENLPVNRPPRRMDPPPVHRPRPVPPSPEVRIGQVDVFIEAPRANPPARRNTAATSRSSASRHYLRRV